MCRYAAVVGMHSDQATEWIVDFALANNKPFAVVPCCVCPTVFPRRRTPAGDPVVRSKSRSKRKRTRTLVKLTAFLISIVHRLQRPEEELEDSLSIVPVCYIHVSAACMG